TVPLCLRIVGTQQETHAGFAIELINLFDTHHIPMKNTREYRVIGAIQPNIQLCRNVLERIPTESEDGFIKIDRIRREFESFIPVRVGDFVVQGLMAGSKGKELTL